MPVADEFQLRVFHPSRPLYTEETLRNYGDAREAAGYARGRAEAGRDAERYRWLRSSEHGVEFRDGDGVWRADCPRAEELDALIDAALRGEVKP